MLTIVNLVITEPIYHYFGMLFMIVLQRTKELLKEDVKKKKENEETRVNEILSGILFGSSITILKSFTGCVCFGTKESQTNHQYS